MAIEIELTSELVSAFAEATGDHSSIHLDRQFARKTRFRERIAHGMLPVFVLLARACPTEQTGGAVRLAGIECRFRDFVKIGERVRFETEKQPSKADQETWSFAVRRSVDGSLVTSGKAAFVSAPRSDFVSGSCTRLLAEPVEELRYTPANLSVGTSERLALRADPSALQSLLYLVDRQIGVDSASAVFADRSATALVALSTLIGMRLPGRFATFLEFEAAFPDAFYDQGEVILEAKVANVARSGSRIGLQAAWLQNSRVVGTATASSALGVVSETSVSCAEIKARHLNLGLAGKVALITGASRGIGEATAKMLAMNGARVVVHFFRGVEDADAIVKDIAANGGHAIALGADLADQQSVAGLFSGIEQHLGPVDILVNNAVSSFSPKPTEDLQPSDYLSELNISLFGMHACCRLALPHMRRQRWGKIINMGTIATEVPVASQNRYITAKSAVVGYTRSLAMETADDNIQVNLVAPSMTETSLIAGLPRALVERLAGETPGGVLLTPVDVAKVVVFLASDWAGSLSGQQAALTKGGPPFS